MNKKLKILHISDTHGYHALLNIPNDIDMIIHSGDFSNYKDYYSNEPEMLSFIHWFGNLKVKYKVLIAGNHDACPAIAPKDFLDWCIYYGIHYLEHEEITIEGLKIFGSPYTPTFGNWHFNKDRSKLDGYWNKIPDDTDILVVHGPPKGCLDLSYNREGVLEFCGCKSLKNHVLNRLNLKYCLFGHIHNFEDIINAGTMKLSCSNTIFSNGSVVTDRKFGILTSQGNVFELEVNNE